MVEHGHGGHSHSHDHGAISLPADSEETAPTEQRQRADSMSSLYQHPAQVRANLIETAQEYGYGKPASDENTGFMGAMSPPSSHHRQSSMSRQNKKRGSQGGSKKIISQATIPALGTDDIRSPVSANREVEVPSEAVDDGHGHDHAHKHKHMAVNASDAEAGHGDHGHGHDHSHEGHGSHGSHGSHGHSGGGGGHSHGSMNMRGVFLHVLGDA
jgi:zinc transporter 1